MKDVLDDPNVVGYCGILIQKRLLWQGFVIDSRLEGPARHLINQVRTLAATNEAMSKLMTGVSKTKTLWAFPGVSPSDQPVIGGIAATAVHHLLSGNLPILAVYLAALRILLERDYFVLHASEDDGGWHTTLQPLAGTTSREARESLRDHMGVRVIEVMRLLGG